MDYYTLLDTTVDLGYELAMCGAETYRVEESVSRILATYGIQSEVFAIPNCLIVSIETPTGKPMTRMRRIGPHGNNLDGVERLSALSRSICAKRPEPQAARRWLHQVCEAKISYPLPITLLGNFLGAAGYGLFFGGNLMDALWAGLLGVMVGLVNRFLDTIHANAFFSTIAASFLMSLTAYTLGALELGQNPDASIMGTVMLLVPGLLFTNAMRDIIYGDTNSGVNRITQVFLAAAAIGLGTAAGWNTVNLLFGPPDDHYIISYGPLIQALAACMGCAGFVIVFNVHGHGSPACVIGGGVTWLVYLLVIHLGGSDIIANFWAALFSGFFAEAMARIRKQPAIAYLVISLLPLIPGGGIYRAVNFAVRGNMDMFVHTAVNTAAVAGILAVGILMASTTVRVLHIWKMQKQTGKR